MNKREMGTVQEQVARAALEQAGYKICEMNYRCRMGEIDMIAHKDGYIVFVEVKYRKDLRKGEPALAVGYAKQRKILSVARYYIMEQGLMESQAYRFDVVAILGEKIEIIENAFGF